MGHNHNQNLAQLEACAAHAHLQWALYALPPRHPARLKLMLAMARADCDRQASLRSSEDDERHEDMTTAERRIARFPGRA
jgi:hypothetical protein